MSINSTINNNKKHNDDPDFHEANERVILPLPPGDHENARFEMEIYARFMRHLREVPNSRMEIKILSSIQFTADFLDVADSLVAKTLVDLGLRAPRKAFPTAFLDFADRASMRASWKRYTPPAGVIQLKSFWEKIGETPFIHGFRKDYMRVPQSLYVTT